MHWSTTGSENVIFCDNVLVSLDVTPQWLRYTLHLCGATKQEVSVDFILWTLSWVNGLLSSYQTAYFLLGLDKDVTMLQFGHHESWLQGQCPPGVHVQHQEILGGLETKRGWNVLWNSGGSAAENLFSPCDVFKVCGLSKHTDLNVLSVNLIKHNEYLI